MVVFTKLSFIVFIVRFIFLLNHFLVVELYKLSNCISHLRKCAISSGICQNSIVIHLCFFYFNCLPDVVPCKSAIWADDNAVNSWCNNTSYLSQQDEILLENISVFHQLSFYFEVSRFQVIYSISNIKRCCPEIV